MGCGFSLSMACRSGVKILQASANSSLLQNDGDDDSDDNDDGEHPSSRFQFIAPSIIHAGDSGSDGEYDGGVGDELRWQR